MSVDAATQAAIKEQQLSGCPSEKKIAIVITGNHIDQATKATFYTFQAFKQTGDNTLTADSSYRYSQLLSFNEELIKNYGNIRLLRVFPGKKWVGNTDADFVSQRQDQIQKWATELVLDEELCEEPLVLKFFKIPEE